MAEHCSAQATDILRKPSKRGVLWPLASPSSTVFPYLLPWPNLHLLVRPQLSVYAVEFSTTLLPTCFRASWVMHLGTWTAPCHSFSPPALIYLFPIYSYLTPFIYLFLVCFLWMVGSTTLPVLEKSWGWSNLFIWRRWMKWMDRELGGVKDYLHCFYVELCGDCETGDLWRVTFKLLYPWLSVNLDNSIGSLLDKTVVQCNIIQVSWWQFQPVPRLQSRWKWSYYWCSTITSDTWLYCELLSLFFPQRMGSHMAGPVTIVNAMYTSIQPLRNWAPSMMNGTVRNVSPKDRPEQTRWAQG